MKREFNFIMGTPPDEEIVAEFHRDFANYLIKKYGVPTIKEVVKRIEAKEED